MDRVNRSLLIASTLFAIPTALLMAPLSEGKSPEVQLAVGYGVQQNQAVQQVADRQTRPGLLQVLAGASSKGSENHQHQNMTKTPSKGLLESLFSRSTASKQKPSSHSSHTAAQHAQHTHHSQHAQHTSSLPNPHVTPASTDQPDWSGIPYHPAEAATGQASTPVPLRDPGSPALAAETPASRIVRGGSSRSLQAVPASARRPSEPAADSDLPVQIEVPTPPREESIAIETSESLSSSTSSRRNGRRSFEALSNPDSVSRTTSSPQPIADDSDVVDLVPKVARRPIQAEPAMKGTVNAKPASSSVSSEAEKVASDNKAEVAAMELPQANRVTGQGTASAKDEANTQPMTKDSASLSYATPADEALAPAPTAGSQSHSSTGPKPASSATLGVPASAVSHRSGPPSQAFGSDDAEQSSTGASNPVGSGVVPNSGVASYRRPSQPVYEVAENTDAATDPYGEVVDPNGRKLSTTGQSVPSLTNQTVPRNALDVPTQPIQGYSPQESSTLPGDSFSATANDGRNQMREGQADSSSTSELPGIRVTTIGPGAIMIRQTNQYEIRVENRGAIDATGVMVRALIPDWADVRGQNATRGDIDNQTQGSSERLVWTIDQLPAGAAETMCVRLTAARSGTYDLDVDWTMLPQKSTSKVHVREPRLDLTIEGPEEVVYGQSQTYKVRVLNPGDGTAPNVVFTLSPNSATPQTQRIGDIPPGKEAQFDVELTAQDLGDLKIHGLASGDLELRAESEKTIRVAAAKLEAVLSGPEVKYQNTDAMYSLQIQNNGSATSERVVASLRLPIGAKYLGGIEEAVQEGAVLRWEINALAPGANRNYQFSCNMGSTGEHLFAFECKGSAAGSASVSIATRVESIADLVLTVSDPVAPAPIGTDVTYEIVIRNRGSKEATDVRAIAQFSHGIEPQRIEGQSGEVMTGQVLFDSIPRIAAGQEVRLKVIAQAAQAGHHRFRTEIRSGETVLVAEEATHYMSPKGDRVSRRSSETSTR